MEAKTRDWQLHLFGGVEHSFTDSAVDALALPGMAYNALADRTSWAMMCTLIGICFETAPPQRIDQALSIASLGSGQRG
jgi:hypothetical protein